MTSVVADHEDGRLWLGRGIELRRLPGDPARPWVIDAIDPWGRVVLCNDDWWKVHVVDEKPEFAADDMFQAACDAVSQPECLTASKAHPRRECYYRAAPFPYEGQLVKVVVEFHRVTKRGMVITGDRVPTVTYGERVIWRKP